MIFCMYVVILMSTPATADIVSGHFVLGPDGPPLYKDQWRAAAGAEGGGEGDGVEEGAGSY